jgi:outer membrane receptor for ferrienterochelin and colicin
MKHDRRPLLLAACLAAAASGGATASAAGGALEDLESLLSKPVYAASKFAQDASLAPAAVTVLTAGDIKAYGWRTLADVLNAVRGIGVRDDRLYTYVGVRGFGPPGDYSSRVLLMIDGMRVNDNLYDQAVAGREFPLAVDLIERVEVIAGPGSALYGSNAVLAVVNVVTQSVSQLGGGSASVAFGSQRSRLLSVRQGMRLGEGALVISARAETRPGGNRYYAEYDSPPASDGVARRQDAERDHKLYVKWTAGEWSVAALASDRDKHVPTGAYGVDFNTRASSTDRYGMADVQWQRDLGQGAQLFARGTLARYEYNGLSLYGGELWTSPSVGHWAAGEARWMLAPMAGHRVIAGFEWQANLRQQQASTNDSTQNPENVRIEGRGHRYGLFVNDEWTLSPAWRLALGVRADRLLDGGHEITPRLGLVWTPIPGMHWKLLGGRAFREPNAYEADYADGTTSLANPALGLEKLQARELALDWRVSANLRLAGSLFENDVSGLITQVVEPASGLLQFVNQGNAEARGLELELDHVADSGWRTRASWSRQTTRDQLSGHPLANSPRSLTKLHVTGPLPVVGWRLGLEGQRVGRRATVAGTTMPAQTLLHSTLLWAPPASRWSLSGTVHNLADRRHADPAGPEHLQSELVHEGRRFTLQGSLAF